MQDPIFADAQGRQYTVRDGVSTWLDEMVPEAVETLEYVGFGRRLAARLIDLLLTYAIAFAAGLATVLTALFVAALAGAPRPTFGQLGLGGVLLSLIAATSFDVVADAIHGSTPGKMLLGITVRSAGGGCCTLAQALKREVAFFIDGLFFGIPALTSMRGSHFRQRIGDKWAGTVVVRNRSLGPAARRSALRFVGATAAACGVYFVLVGVGVLL